MFLVVATLNLVLLIVLGVLVIQIRGFVREAEKSFSGNREKILHPLLDFEQIRSIPSVRDIEVLLLSVALLIILYFLSIIERENLAESYAHWWVTLEVGSVLVFSHAMLRYSRHLVDRDHPDWHRAYHQTRDFFFFRSISMFLIVGVVLWMAFGLPTLSLDTGQSTPGRLESFNAGDDLTEYSRDTVRDPLDRDRLAPYWGPVLVLRSVALLLVGYVLNWVLRLRGELVTLMKTIGILIVAASAVGWWMIAFKFDPDPTNWPVSEAWAFSEWTHLCYTGILLSLVLLLFKDNMVLLGATHRAAQIIADEKRVMVDFLVRVAEDPSSFDRDNPARRLRQDLDHILSLTLEFSMRQSNAKAGAIYLLDTILEGNLAGSAGRHLVPRVVEGLYPPLQALTIDYLATRIKYINELFLTERVNLDAYPFFDQLIREGELLYLPATKGHDEIPQQATDFLRINSLIAVPLRVQDQVLGLLMVINKLSEGEREWEEFTPQDASLLNAVADQASIAIANARMHEVIDEQERLEREIEIARKVQESLLPESCPVIEGYRIEAFSKAARQIGGDYYDFAWMDENRLVIAVADVAGKGIPGALTMATLRSALRALVRQTRSAKELVITLNDFIYEDLKRDVFISVTLGVLDLRTNRIDLIRAGHEPIILTSRKGKSTEQFVPDGIALGLDRGLLFTDSLEEFSYEMESGDLIFLYTDGVTEAMNSKREEYSCERLVHLLENHRDDNLEKILDTLKDDLKMFTGDSPPHDDVTVVAIQKL